MVDFLFLRQPFAHRFSLQGDRIGIVHEPVKDRVSERRLPDGGMPVLDRELTGDHGRPPAMAIVQHFEQIAAGLLRQRGQAPVVQNEQIRLESNGIQA